MTTWRFSPSTELKGPQPPCLPSSLAARGTSLHRWPLPSSLYPLCRAPSLAYRILSLFFGIHSHGVEPLPLALLAPLVRSSLYPNLEPPPLLRRSSRRRWCPAWSPP